MSQWRRKASEVLPEFQRIIASPDIDNPMSLWIELRYEFMDRCAQTPTPLGLLRRFWTYCAWCLSHPDQNVSTAAALGFCEHLIDSESSIKILPYLMTREDFSGLKNLIAYHHSEEEFETVLKSQWNK